MSNLINNIHRKVFQTRIIRKTHLGYVADPNLEPVDIPIEYLRVGVIIMSRDTHMEVLKQDYTNSTGVAYFQDRSQPYRMFGIRVAFDDSLPPGEVLVAGDVV
jgi:hypothetical protein